MRNYFKPKHLCNSLSSFGSMQGSMFLTSLEFTNLMKIRVWHYVKQSRVFPNNVINIIRFTKVRVDRDHAPSKFMMDIPI